MSEQPWWAGVDPEVERLARRIAERHGVPVDTPALPYPPVMFQTGTGEACVISQNDMRPLWTYYTNMARHALEMRDDQAITDVVGPEGGTYKDETPDDKWRADRGLEDNGTV